MSEFLRQCWYMAGWSHEVGEPLLRRQLLGDPMLLFRREDGSLAAMLDRCPHRYAPLSMGSRSGDTVTCAYHGLSFDSHGACVASPFSPTTPKGMAVRSFVVEERDGIVWFWAGDPALADPAAIPDFAMLFQPGLGDPLTGYMAMAAPYEYGTDNLLDLSHIEFVHKGSFAGNGVIFAGQHSLREDGDRLHSDWFMPDVAAPAHTFGSPLFGQRCDHWLDMRWDAPASMYLQVGACAAGTGAGAGAGRENSPVVAHQAHILTPETATSTHYFWASTRNGPPSEQGDAMLRALFTQAFDEEDKPIIEAAYRNTGGADFWALKPGFLGIDAGGTKARRLLQQRIAQEGQPL